MHSVLNNKGYQIIPQLISTTEQNLLLAEFDQLSQTSQRGCVRHVLDRSTVIHKFANSKRLIPYLPDKAQPVRCILFDKTPEHNWPVAWHQDLTIAVTERHETPEYTNWSIKDGVIHVQPPEALLQNMVTLRLHLDDTTATNGALKVIERSHLYGKIPSEQIGQFTCENQVTCECSAGDLLIMKPLILHASDRSKCPSHRRIIHIEYIDRELLHPNLSWHDNI